jgi:esterase/lipase superfamily enzyme
MSGFAFARALEKLRQRQITATDPQNDVPECLKRINVLAHSMGNRVLREALRIWCSSFLGNHPPLLFRNTFMASADVVNETLHTPEGRNITNASANIVVYFASDDLALRASKIANAGQASRRLGHTGPGDLTRIPHRVVSIDCDAVNSKYDNPKGHSYFLRDQHGRPGAVFRHIFSTIQSGRVGDPPNPLQRVG